MARVVRACGLSRPTIYQGVRDLDAPLALARVRRPGGGRPTTSERDPALVAALDALIEPDTRGDPGSPLRWTCTSTRQLAAALTAQGHPISHSSVADLLRAADYSLQAPRLTFRHNWSVVEQGAIRTAEGGAMDLTGGEGDLLTT